MFRPPGAVHAIDILKSHQRDKPLTTEATEAHRRNPRRLHGLRIRVTPLSRFCSLRTHLFHELAHGGDVPWRAGFTPGLVALRGYAHRVVEILHEVILEEPIACLAKSGFAALFIDLKMELCLFVSRFCRHDRSSPFIWCLMN